MQYLAPSIQFLFGEPFRPEQQVGFGCTWAALLLFTADSALAQLRQSLCKPEGWQPTAGAAPREQGRQRLAWGANPGDEYDSK